MEQIGMIFSAEDFRHEVEQVGTLDEFQLLVSITGTPVLKSTKTGKFFVISWGQIAELAITAGINKE